MGDRYEQTFLCQCAYMANSSLVLPGEGSLSGLDGLGGVADLLPDLYGLLEVKDVGYLFERLHNTIYYHEVQHLAFSPL